MHDIDSREHVPDQLCHLERQNKIIVHPLCEASLLNQCTFCNQSPYLSLRHSVTKAEGLKLARGLLM